MLAVCKGDGETWPRVVGEAIKRGKKRVPGSEGDRSSQRTNVSGKKKKKKKKGKQTESLAKPRTTVPETIASGFSV